MCGIAGDFSLQHTTRPDEESLRRMIAMLRHRGPEDAGMYLDDRAGLALARLSIVDIEGGRQPLCNEDGTVWAVCNGEFFNYVELREQLQRRGHRFRTGSDVEMIVHLYEERGVDCVQELIGDFAYAIWDTRAQRLVLTRDRLGVRPLFYTTALPGHLLFASEVKAIFANPHVPRSLDLQSLAQTFTYWSPLPGRSMFEGVRELPAGHTLVAEGGEIDVRPYWTMQVRPESPSIMSEDDAVDELRSLLVDATRLRLRADVPVGTYLSGGIDSTAITGIVQELKGDGVESFSIAFTDAHYDEREFQQRAVERLGIVHHVLEISCHDIAEALPEVIWHAEAAILRTSPAPMFLLSRLVQQTGLKVVLTGEGADEVLGGYDIFKEAKIRRFWARQPGSALRPRLLGRLYDDVQGLERVPLSYLKAQFGQGLDETDDPGYSHLGRWRSTARLQRFFSPAVRQAFDAVADRAELAAVLEGAMVSNNPVARAQYVETAIFLPQYLLSSQEDRVALAHAVETRVPFLDHRVVEFANRLPSSYKLRGLREKHLLRRAMGGYAPESILERPKRPYRAPTAEAVLGPDAPAYVGELLSEAALRRTGLFDPAAFGLLLQKGNRSGRLSEFESMAVIGVLTAQLLHRHFLEEFDARVRRQPRPVVHRVGACLAVASA